MTHPATRFTKQGVKRGRPGKLRIGATVRILVSGDRAGTSLIARVERNSPALVVEVIEADPIWHGCRLNQRQCKVIAVIDERDREHD